MAGRLGRVGKVSGCMVWQGRCGKRSKHRSPSGRLGRVGKDSRQGRPAGQAVDCRADRMCFQRKDIQDETWYGGLSHPSSL